MPSIQIDESSPAKSVTFAQTLLRSVVGGILISHGVQKLMQLPGFSDALVARLGIADADAHALAYAVLGIELAAGVGLIVGLFTRFSAFAMVSASAFAFAMEAMRVGGVLTGQTGFELMLVLVCVGTLFMFVGGGPLSLDAAWRERRRRKAIENDAIWSQPPYVSPAHQITD